MKGKRARKGKVVPASVCRFGFEGGKKEVVSAPPDLGEKEVVSAPLGNLISGEASEAVSYTHLTLPTKRIV